MIEFQGISSGRRMMASLLITLNSMNCSLKHFMKHLSEIEALRMVPVGLWAFGDISPVEDSDWTAKPDSGGLLKSNSPDLLRLYFPKTWVQRPPDASMSITARMGSLTRINPKDFVRRSLLRNLLLSESCLTISIRRWSDSSARC